MLFNAKLVYERKKNRDIKLGSMFCGSNILHRDSSNMFATTIEGSLFNNKTIIFPQNLPLVMLTFAMTHLYPKCKLQSNTCKDEMGSPLQYDHNVRVERILYGVVDSYRTLIKLFYNSASMYLLYNWCFLNLVLGYIIKV